MLNKQMLLPFVFHLMIFIAKSQTFSGTLAVHIATQGMRGNECDVPRPIANCRFSSEKCALLHCHLEESDIYSQEYDIQGVILM